jgi:hypothetical protein
LLLESLTAAEKAGVRERILDSISQTFPGIDWRETATYYIGRTQQHGARRVTEMKEAATTLESFAWSRSCPRRSPGPSGRRTTSSSGRACRWSWPIRSCWPALAAEGPMIGREG